MLNEKIQNTQKNYILNDSVYIILENRNISMATENRKRLSGDGVGKGEAGEGISKKQRKLWLVVDMFITLTIVITGV